MRRAAGVRARGHDGLAARGLDRLGDLARVGRDDNRPRSASIPRAST